MTALKRSPIARQKRATTGRKARRRVYPRREKSAPPPSPPMAGKDKPVVGTSSGREPSTGTAILTPVPSAPTPGSSRSPLLLRMKVNQAVHDHALLAGGAMVIPIPFLDMAAEVAIQIKMVRRLCELYGIDFAEERAKAMVAAVVGGVSAGWAAGRLLRYASFATYFSNFWPSAILSSAITYVIGQIFIHHFDAGGGLHDLDAKKAAGILREKASQLTARRR